MAAKMATEKATYSMIGHADAAMGAISGETALRADHGSGVATPVKKKNRLFSFLETFADRFPQGLGQNLRESCLEQLLTHVDQVNGGHGAVIDSFGKGVQGVLSDFDVSHRLKGWCGRPENTGGSG